MSHAHTHTHTHTHTYTHRDVCLHTLIHTHTHTHRMSKIAIEASKKGIRDGVRNLVLEICCTDEAGEDAEVPYIKYNFK